MTQLWGIKGDVMNLGDATHRACQDNGIDKEIE